METIGESAQVWVTSRTSGRRESRGSVIVSDLRSIVTHTLTPDGPNGPNGPVTQYILAAAERHLYAQLRGGFGGDDRESAILSRMLPLEAFGPEVLDISRNNMRRRWATSADWLDDVIAFALRPDRAVDHARVAVGAAGDAFGKPLGDIVRMVAAGEVAAERDPARFRLAEIIRTVWPDHPAVRAARDTFDEYVVHWWVPFYTRVLDVYGLTPLPGTDVEDVAWPLLTLVQSEARSGNAQGRAAAAILLLISGAVIDRDTGARLTASEIDALLPASSVSNAR